MDALLTLRNMEDIKISNDIKILHLSVADIKSQILTFAALYIEVKEIDLSTNDVPENEIWDISEFRNYKVKLVNNGGQAEVVDFDDWKEKNRKE